VHPVEVDVVGLQAPQRLLARCHKGLSTRSPGVGIAAIHVREKLRGDYHAVAAGRMPADVIADNLFRMPLGVTIGGVDEIAAEVDEAVENAL